MPDEPISNPTVMKMRSSDLRDAPIVRNIAMSRVFARTNMIRDDNMLKTATRTMIDKTTNMATRSTANASNSEAFMLFQSTISPLFSSFGSSSISMRARTSFFVGNLARNGAKRRCPARWVNDGDALTNSNSQILRKARTNRYFIFVWA